MDVVGDEGVPSSQRQEGAAAEAGIRGGVGGGEAVPMPPIFGNANAGTAADMDFKVRHEKRSTVYYCIVPLFCF